MYRTHTCGELSKKDVGKETRVAGWVQSRRDHGGIIFIDLRDRYGITQVVLDPKHNPVVHKNAEHLGREYVIAAKGKVRPRMEGMENPNLKTGEIEVIVDDLLILNESKTPPIEIEDRTEADEETRLRYRYLDLRRPIMQERLKTRAIASQAAREFLSGEGFLEIETPILIRSTPEGARDYVVPSRVNPGKFYALPQSPQLYKQTLMIAGFDRYYQLARCLRDEDLRADRQPEHTQIDLEMSFVEQDDILQMVERMYKHITKKTIGKDISIPFPRMTYKEAMETYGSDKPDVRFGLKFIDVTEIVRKSDFKVFAEAANVKCINPEHEFSRNEVDSLIDWSTKNGAKGMAWMKVTENGVESSIVKYFNPEIQKEIIEKTKAKKGYLFFIADKPKKVNEILSKLRIEVARRSNLIPQGEFKFLWVTDFPLFEFNEDEQQWEPAHHFFTNPNPDDVKYIESDPGRVRGQLYDLVLNGVELGSGSIRITSPQTQKQVMGVVGITSEEAERKFGFLLEAFKYGAPPHGGMGLGFDRFVALLQGLNDIREVIAFPKNKKAQSPMDGSPADIDERQMKELHIKTDIIKK